MPKALKGSTKPGEMCSYDPKTGLYTDRWLWEEMLGEDFSTPPGPMQDYKFPGTPRSYDPSIPLKDYSSEEEQG